MIRIAPLARRAVVCTALITALGLGANALPAQALAPAGDATPTFHPHPSYIGSHRVRAALLELAKEVRAGRGSALSRLERGLSSDARAALRRDSAKFARALERTAAKEDLTPRVVKDSLFDFTYRDLGGGAALEIADDLIGVLLFA